MSNVLPHGNLLNVTDMITMLHIYLRIFHWCLPNTTPMTKFLGSEHVLEIVASRQRFN